MRASDERSGELDADMCDLTATLSPASVGWNEGLERTLKDIAQLPEFKRLTLEATMVTESGLFEQAASRKETQSAPDES